MAYSDCCSLRTSSVVCPPCLDFTCLLVLTDVLHHVAYRHCTCRTTMGSSCQRHAGAWTVLGWTDHLDTLSAFIVTLYVVAGIRVRSTAVRTCRCHLTPPPGLLHGDTASTRLHGLLPPATPSTPTRATLTGLPHHCPAATTLPIWQDAHDLPSVGRWMVGYLATDCVFYPVATSRADFRISPAGRFFLVLTTNAGLRLPLPAFPDATGGFVLHGTRTRLGFRHTPHHPPHHPYLLPPSTTLCGRRIAHTGCCRTHGCAFTDGGLVDCCLPFVGGVKFFTYPHTYSWTPVRFTFDDTDHTRAETFSRQPPATYLDMILRFWIQWQHVRFYVGWTFKAGTGRLHYTHFAPWAGAPPTVLPFLRHLRYTPVLRTLPRLDTTWDGGVRSRSVRTVLLTRFSCVLYFLHLPATPTMPADLLIRGCSGYAYSWISGSGYRTTFQLHGLTIRWLTPTDLRYVPTCLLRVSGIPTTGLFLWSSGFHFPPYAVCIRHLAPWARLPFCLPVTCSLLVV